MQSALKLQTVDWKKNRLPHRGIEPREVLPLSFSVRHSTTNWAIPPWLEGCGVCVCVWGGGGVLPPLQSPLSRWRRWRGDRTWGRVPGPSVPGCRWCHDCSHCPAACWRSATRHVGEPSVNTCTQMATRHVGEPSGNTCTQMATRHVGEPSGNTCTQLATRHVGEPSGNTCTQLATRHVGEPSGNTCTQLATRHVGEPSGNTCTQLAAVTQSSGAAWDQELREIRSCVSSGAVWEWRWPSWAPRPNEPYGFFGRKVTLNHAHALVTVCP